MSNQLKFEGPVSFGGIDPLSLPKSASDPGSANDGDMYFNTTSHKARIYASGVWTDVGAGSGTGVNVDKYTLSGTDISNGFVTLTTAPATPSKTRLDVIGGPTQDYGVDFSVSGTTLTWTSLGLDGVLVSGDKLIVQYS